MKCKFWEERASEWVQRAFEVSEGVRLLWGSFILRKESIVCGRWFWRLGSCLVSDKLNNSRELLWLFFNQGEGYYIGGILFNINKGMGRIGS